MEGKRAGAIYCTRKCKTAASEQRRTRDDQARYQKERDKRTKYASEYQKKNPHVPQRAKRKRKARSASAGIFTISARDWLRLIRRYGGRCYYCGASGRMTMDHVIPISRGGTHSIGNLLPACASCNSKKRTRTIMEWRLARRSYN